MARETPHVVLVADAADHHEALVGDLPPHNEAYLHGELEFPRLLAMIRGADVLAGGVGWIVPADIAAHTKTFIIFGGRGGINPASLLRCPTISAAAATRSTHATRRFRAWRSSSGLGR